MPRSAELMVLKFDAATGDFSRKVKLLERQTEGMKGRLDRTLKQIDRTTAGISASLLRAFGPLAAAATVGGALQGLRRLTTEMAELTERADLLGISIEQLQELRFAAEETGVTARQLDVAWQRFTRRVGEAAQGSGELRSTLEQYNIAVRDADGQTRDTVEVFKDLADATQSAESSNEQLRIAFKAFDSEGAQLVRLLRQGSAGLEAFTRQAHDLGLVLDQDLVRSAQELDRRFDRLTERLSVRFKQVTLDVLDFIGAFDSQLPTQRLAELQTELEAVQRKFLAVRDRPVPSSGQAQVQRSDYLQALVQEELRLQRLIKAQEVLAAIEQRARTPPASGTADLGGGGSAQRLTNDGLRKEIGLRQDVLAQLEEEARLAAMLPRARFVEQARLRAQAEALRENNGLTEEHLAKVETVAGRLYDLQNAQKGVTDETERSVLAAEDFRSVATGALGSLITQGQEVESVLARIAQQFASIGVNRLGNQAFDALLGGLGFADGGIAKGGIKPFASGGVVTRPTLGLVGEGRHNEAIIPLPDGRSVPVVMQGGAQSITLAPSITVNVTAGHNQSPRRVGEEVGREVARAIKGVVRDELQVQSRPGGMLNRGQTV